MLIQNQVSYIYERITPSTDYNTIRSNLNELESVMYFIKAKGKPI
jgi:hypothetical protein